MVEPRRWRLDGGASTVVQGTPDPNLVPSLFPLAFDERFAGIPLRVDAVEFLFEPFRGALAAIDRDVDGFFALERTGCPPIAISPADPRRCAVHRSLVFLWFRRFFRPQKCGPDQCAPVAACAAAESDL